MQLSPDGFLSFLNYVFVDLYESAINKTCKRSPKRKNPKIQPNQSKLIPLIKGVASNSEKKTVRVLWNDGTATQVTASEHDVFDAEKGFALAILKYLYGNRYYRDMTKIMEKKNLKATKTPKTTKTVEKTETSDNSSLITIDRVETKPTTKTSSKSSSTSKKTSSSTKKTSSSSTSKSSSKKTSSSKASSTSKKSN